MNKLIYFLKSNKFFLILSILVLITLIIKLIVPAQGDEITYLNIAKNINYGKFYLNEYPTTVTPVIPFVLTFFYIEDYLTISLLLNRILNICFLGLGIMYLFRFLTLNNIKLSGMIMVMILTITTPVIINFTPTIYPDALLFCLFWAIMYYSSLENTITNYKKILLLFTIIFLTRYLYAVLGIILIFKLFLLSKKDLKQFRTAVFYSIIALTPVIIWFKYVYNIESNNLAELTYFSRFKEEMSTWYNIKAGLGLIQHQEVHRINGLPAFINIFVPITGFRNFTLSLIMLVLFISGYILNKNKNSSINLLFFAVVLVMLGLIFSGTGFTRYWIPLIPAYYLGYYFLLKRFHIQDKFIIFGSYALALIYFLNEVRVNIHILQKYML